MHLCNQIVQCALCLILLVQCGGHNPGDPPRGKKLPEFFGVFLWDGQLEPLQAGETVWRGGQKPALDGIVLYDSSLTSGGARPEELVALFSATPLRKEIEYFFTSDGAQLARVEVRPASGFLDNGERLPLKIMPLEKPGAVMVVPTAQLGTGLYVLEFMGKKHRFSIGMASAQETSQLADKSRDRILSTTLSPRSLFTDSGPVTREEPLRDPKETDREAEVTKAEALESWKEKDFAHAIGAAVVAFGYFPDDQTLMEINTQGRLTAAKECLAAKKYADAKRWAEQVALHHPAQVNEAQTILREANLLPHLENAEAEIKKKDFSAAKQALNHVSFEGRKDPRFGDMERDLKRAEVADTIQKSMDAKQWDEALDLVHKAVEDGTLNLGPANGWISRIRQGAAADSLYFGKLHQPVWEVKLGEGEMRMHGMRKAPGNGSLVVCVSRGQLDEESFFTALNAVTGEVEWMVSMPEGRLESWSEDGRYAVMSDSPSGFQNPETCHVVDLKERKRLPGTQRPWPASHSQPVAVHGGSRLLAMAVRSRELEVELIDLASGEVRHRIAPKGIRGQPLSEFAAPISFVRTLCFSRDGKNLLSYSEDQTLRVFDIATGSQIGNGVEHSDSLGQFRDGVFHLSNDGQRVICTIDSVFDHSIFRTMGAGSRRENLSTVLTLHPNFGIFIDSGGMFASKSSEVFSLSPDGKQQRIGALQAPFGIQCAAFDDQDPVIFIAGGGGYVARLAVSPPKEGDDAFSPDNGTEPRQIDTTLAERLVSFVTAHHARTDQRDVDSLMADYAEQVDYYNFGMIQPARLRELLQDMFTKTGKRNTTVKHQPEPQPLSGGSISLDYPILIQEEGKEDRELQMTLEVRLVGSGDEIKIVRKKSAANQ